MAQIHKENVFYSSGEFGSVMEGQLNQDDYILKVAVKTMKSKYCSSGCVSPIIGRVRRHLS